MKNKLIILMIVGVFVAGGVMLMPGRSSADTDQSVFDKLQNQIQVLLKQVQDLQRQLESIRNGITPVQPTITQPVSPATPISIVCPGLPKIIKFGNTGNEVKNIQKFLAKDKEIYPQGLATGYFGPMTEKALEKFQKKYNLEETGELDDNTKDVLEKVIGPTIGSTATGGGSGGGYNCIIPPTPDPRPNPVPPVVQGISVISPINGEQWEVGKTYKIAWRSLIATTAGSPGLVFDDMSKVSIKLERYFACLYANPACGLAQPAPYVIVGETSNNGVYEWKIPSDLVSSGLYEKARIIVSIVGQEGIIYGKSGLFSLTPQISPPDPSPNGIKVISPVEGSNWQAGKTYNINWFTAIPMAGYPTSTSFDNVSIRFEKKYSCDSHPGESCIALDSISYVIIASTPNDGSFSWTIPAEFSGSSGRIVVSVVGYESINGRSGVFKIVSNDFGSNKPPVISGVSGPSSLKIGETGNWTVKAYDPENDYMFYDVRWGDEPQPPMGTPTPVQMLIPTKGQTTTFTHAYQTAGNYTVKFTVSDDKGLTAKTSMSVMVGSGTSTNSPPVISMNALPGQVNVGAPVSSLWTATDIDGDSFFWTIYWGDGDASTCPPGTVSAQSYLGYQYPLMFGNCSNFSVSHTWSNIGTYTVVGTVYDGRGGTDARKFQITVVNTTTSTASST
ncbi:MAG: peptidoglycan-binding protein [Candidatus Paceibacterota bacterium]|jgi:peptidoglycan hydrolase-like protein with peptidoglycan-binding domain